MVRVAVARVRAELMASAVRLSLHCPLSRTRLGVPVRGVTCRHLECFDLASYLECARVARPPKWACPLCASDAKPSKLRVDSWVAWVLQTAPADASDVQVSPDGSISQAAQATPRKRKRAAAAEGESSGEPKSRPGETEDDPICLD